MGIDKHTDGMLRAEAAKRPFSGALLTLGVQTILGEANKDVGYFKSLGFETVRRMDVSPHEGADIIYDLNNDLNLFPELYAETFDCIIDGGTLEHVFNVPNALKNLFYLLKVGGRVLHFVASSGYIDHGFYMFSPMLFNKFYSVNKFEILSDTLWHEDVVDRYLECFIAVKRVESTDDKVPQQMFGVSTPRSTMWHDGPETI
jgi:hypothetical protein